jgi:hypothetical protein
MNPPNPLTFSIANGVNGHANLIPVPYSSISEQMWQEAAYNINLEKGLRHYPGQVLAERWQQGLASVAVKDDCIVSYISLVPVLCQETWPTFCTEMGIDLCAAPDIDVYGGATGWTHPAWRQKGISTQLRLPLYERLSAPNCLYICMTVGVGASPLLAKLGWRVAAWSQMPYVGSLMGVPITGFENLVGSAWWAPPDMTRYEGPHIVPGQDTAHDWPRFYHLWVSNAALAADMDKQLREMAHGDLHRWHQAVIVAFTVKAVSPWTLTIFQK